LLGVAAKAPAVKVDTRSIHFCKDEHVRSAIATMNDQPPSGPVDCPDLKHTGIGGREVSEASVPRDPEELRNRAFRQGADVVRAETIFGPAAVPVPPPYCYVLQIPLTGNLRGVQPLLGGKRHSNTLWPSDKHQ
jgi:hypothetical protein